MKKILVLLLTLLLSLSMIGCTKSGNEGGETGEPDVLTFELSTLFIVPALEATQTVENVINDYLTKDLGKNYKIHLKITSIGDYFTTVPMELAGGGDDAPDVVQVFNMADWVNQGYIIALDDYLNKELKGTVDLIGNIIGSGKMAGHMYMIPRYFGTVLDWKFIYNKTLVENAGVDLSTVKDIDSLTPVLAELKKAYPDEHFIVYCDQFSNLYGISTKTSVVGSFAATIGESTQLVNYYETEAYKKAIETAYEYRQKGYCDPEGSANTASHDLVVMSGSSKGVIMGHSADAEGIAKMFTKDNTYGAEFGAITIGIDNLATDSLGVGISYSCKNPSAAADFINLLYTDEFLWDTIIYGAEGQDWVWSDDTHTTVKYPDGLDFNSIPYNVMYSCGMIGNGFQGLTFESDEEDDGSDNGSSASYGKELMAAAWCPPLYGFTPTTVNIMNESAAVTNVVEQYNDSLKYGDVNPADVYPQFIQALKDAGIDKIIADFQTQVDEWVAANK